MTETQAFLLQAAKDTARYLDDRIQGKILKGMYEDMTAARQLAEAIVLVEAEERNKWKALTETTR
jgi:hypothetical protein